MELPHKMFQHINTPLLSAFVERWQPDTNNFHMPCGEMKITLLDVREILGINIEGLPLYLNMEGRGSRLIEAMAGLFCVIEEETKKMTKDGGIPYSFLENVCRSYYHMVQSKVVAYLLWLIGCTLFADNSSDRVHPYFILFILDSECEVSGYTRGAATLAFLYRQLGTTSRGGAKQLVGCATLLEMWIYKHFSGFGVIDGGWQPNQPRCLRWLSNIVTSKNIDNLLYYRRTLDQMDYHTVVWDPYHIDDIHAYCPMTLFHDVMHCSMYVEPHIPDRVTRQFGISQAIPRQSLMPTEPFYRGRAIKAYSVKFTDMVG